MVEIVATDDVLGGTPRLDGRRIAVLQIADMVLDGGHAPEYVADQLEITLAEVYAALTYYYEHPEDMRRERDRWSAIEDELRDEFVDPPKRVEQ